MINNKTDLEQTCYVYMYIDKLFISDMNLLSLAIVKVESFGLLVSAIDFYQIALWSTLSYDLRYCH